MSVKLMSAVWASSPNSQGDLLVELALADHANDDGVCFPLIKTLAAKCRLSDRQVQRAIHLLKQQGRIQVQAREGQSNMYTMTAMSPQMTSMSQDGDASDVSVVTPVSEDGDMGVLHNHNLIIKEPSLNLGTASESKTLSLDQKLTAEGIQWLFNYYVKTLGRNPRSYLLTAKRKSMLHARLEETVRMKGDIPAAINFMARCVDALTQSDWHMGRDPKNHQTYNELENVFGPSKYQQWVTKAERNDSFED